MREWIPVPGSAKARLIAAALHHFERSGFEACSVTDLAAKAGVTTGALYHHFGSKAGLYQAVRADLEKRIIDRMEGAAAVHGRGGDGEGHAAAGAAVLVAFDAAVVFDACRLLGEPPSIGNADPIGTTLSSLLPLRLASAAAIMAAAWRASLLSVADGTPAETARAGLAYVLGAKT